VNAAGWKTARLQDIPSASQLPGFSHEDYFKGMAERAPHILERWADAEARFEGANRKTHAVRGFLGVESFGAGASRTAKPAYPVAANIAISRWPLVLEASNPHMIASSTPSSSRRRATSEA
jgi:hypothetical protein